MQLLCIPSWIVNRRNNLWYDGLVPLPASTPLSKRTSKTDSRKTGNVISDVSRPFTLSCHLISSCGLFPHSWSLLNNPLYQTGSSSNCVLFLFHGFRCPFTFREQGSGSGTDSLVLHVVFTIFLFSHGLRTSPDFRSREQGTGGAP